MTRPCHSTKAAVLVGALAALFQQGAEAQAIKGADGYYQDANLQLVGVGCKPSCQPQCSTPCTPVMPGDSVMSTDDPMIDMAPPPEIDTSAVSSTFGASEGFGGAPHMIGDFIGPGHYGSSGSGRLAANTTRIFKAGEMQSAHVVDRLYTSMTYFNDVGGDLGDFGNATQLTRFQFGFEKTMLEGRASFGLRLPVNIVDPGEFDTGGGQFPVFGNGTATRGGFGDLVGIFKYALVQDRMYGDALTLGLAVQMPTGDDTIAGVEVDPDSIPLIDHNGTIQPFIGALRYIGHDWFVQYFISLDVPFDGNDSTLLFNSIALGQNLRTGRGSGVTGIIPTFELHVSTPLNNRDQVNSDGDVVVGMANQVNAVSGITFEFNNRSQVVLGLVVPMGDVQVNDWELQLQFNVFGSGNGYGVRRY